MRHTDGASDTNPFQRRVEACQDALGERNAEAVICFPGSNMTYLSGFVEEPMERHLLLFVTPSETAFLAPELYAEQLASESWIENRRTWADGDDPRTLIEEIATDLGIGVGAVAMAVLERSCSMTGCGNCSLGISDERFPRTSSVSQAR